ARRHHHGRTAADLPRRDVAKSNRTNRVRRAADSGENQQDTVGTSASEPPVEELDADEAGLDAHDLPGVDDSADADTDGTSAQDAEAADDATDDASDSPDADAAAADSVVDSGKTFPEKKTSPQSAEHDSTTTEHDSSDSADSSVTE